MRITSLLSIGISLRRRGFLLLLIPYLTAGLWYFIFMPALDLNVKNLYQQTLYQEAYTYFNLCILFSFAINSLFADKIGKFRLVYLWSAIMPILMALFMFPISAPAFLILIFLLSYVFSLGVLGYSIYFRDLVAMEERGRISGLLVSSSILTYTIFFSVFRYEYFGYTEFIIIGTSLGLVTLATYFLKPYERPYLTTSNVYVLNYRFKTIVLYLIPWLIFSLINGTLSKIITVHSISKFKEIEMIANLVQITASGFSALLGGIIADWIGRKMTVIVAMVLFGCSITLSLAAYTSTIFLFSWLLNGLAWGVLQTIYLLVIWGDLSKEKECAPYYALGLMPFYFSKAIGYLFLPYMVTISVFTASVIALLLLLFSTIPVVFAEELMPEIIADEMHRKRYIFRIKKTLREKGERAKPD